MVITYRLTRLVMIIHHRLERLHQLIGQRGGKLAMYVAATLHLSSHTTPGIRHAAGYLAASLVQFVGQLRERLRVD